MASPAQAPDRLPANFDFSKPITIPDRLPANFDFGTPVHEAQATADKSATQSHPLSRLGSAFWEGVGGKALSDILAGASRDPERAKKAMDTAKGLVQGIANEPARVWHELSETGSSMLHGDIPGAASHFGKSAPLVGAGAGQVQHDFENGDYASGFGHAMALLLPFAAPELAAKAGALAPGTTTTATAKGAVAGGVKAIPAAIEESVLKYTGLPKLARGAYEGGKKAYAAAKAAEAAPIADEPAVAPSTRVPLRPPLADPNPAPPDIPPAPAAAAPRAPLRPPLTAPAPRPGTAETTQPAASGARPDPGEIALELFQLAKRSGTIPENSVPGSPVSVSPEAYAGAARAKRLDTAAAIAGDLHQNGIRAGDLPRVSPEQWGQLAARQGRDFPGTAAAREKLINDTIKEVMRLEGGSKGTIGDLMQ